MYAYMFHKNQCLRRDIKLIVKYRVIWITSVVIVFLLRTLTRDVKVVQPYLIVFVKHGSFPSLCIGDNHRNVLEWYIFILQKYVFEYFVCCSDVVRTFYENKN